MADDDARDERLAGSEPERLRGLLDVEPLDELTRRRLVTTAVRASAPPSRSRRWVAAAAAVVVLVIGGGVALLVAGGDDTTTPTALNDLGKSATPNTTPPNATPGSPTAEAVTAPVDAGDFGDLSDARNLARARASLGADSPLRSTGQADNATAPSSGASATSGLAAFPCADELPEGTVVAAGTGRFGSRDAVVVAIDQPDGTQTVAAVVADPCEVRPLD